MILSVERLHVDFATSGGRLAAVRGVSFTLDRGEILGIVGESGSGKSVTAHALMRLVPSNGAITDGRIVYRDRHVADMDYEELRALRGNKIAMIFQEPGRSFDPIYSIGRSLAETIRAHNPDLSEDEIGERSIRLLNEVHVSHPESRLDNFPHQFSGGLLQRIMIAHALANDPEILIADEPTTALDVTIQAGIIDLLRELRRSRGLAMIFITHDLALISEFADRLVVMYAGMVMEEGAVGEIIASPRHPYTAGLLGSLVPFGVHHSQRPLATLPGIPPDPIHPEPGCPFAPRCAYVASACTTAPPEIVDSEASAYRCIVPGPKKVGGVNEIGGDGGSR